LDCLANGISVQFRSNSMNRRFIAPFLAVDVTGSRAGDGYSAGSRAPSGNDTDAGFPTGVGPAADAPSAGGGGTVTSQSVDPGCPPNRSAQRLS
jgi:hypothetical protein